jgi:hypothetical protein
MRLVLSSVVVRERGAFRWETGRIASLEMLVLHDDAQREYAYGPAHRLPDTHVGKFMQALYDEAKAKGWTVISMKNDWTRILAGKTESVRPTEPRLPHRGHQKGQCPFVTRCNFPRTPAK